MIVGVIAQTGGFVIALLGATVVTVAVLLRVLRHIDLAIGPDGPTRTPEEAEGAEGAERDDPQAFGSRGEPAWWPEFERQLADFGPARTHPRCHSVGRWKRRRPRRKVFYTCRPPRFRGSS